MSRSSIELKMGKILKASLNDTPRKNVSKALKEGLLAAFLKLKMQKNDILPSNSTLSKLIGISHITLRKALHSLEEDGVVTQMHGKGTYINRDFSSKKHLSGTVAVFLPHIDDLYGCIIDSIGKVLTNSGVKMRIESVSWQNSSSSKWDSLPSFEIDDLIGIIRSPSIYPPALIREIEFYRKINADSVPVVMIDRPLKIEGVSSVGFDDISGMAKIFDYIWDLKFRNIYFVYPNMMNQNMRNAERGEGFKQAAEKHNYNYEKKIIAAQMVSNDYFENMFNYILDNNGDDTAFICSNDGVANIVNNIVMKRKVKSQRIKVTGFDRSETTEKSNCTFPSAFRSRKLLGKIAAELLIEKMKQYNSNRRIEKNITLEPLLTYK